MPLLAVVGGVLTVACIRLPSSLLWAPGTGAISWFGGLDIVIGYQVSWILMFSDYSRYTRSGSRAGIAVFLGLALTSLWLMPLGVMAARAAASSDPGAMLQALKLGLAGAVLMTVATVTTNFVNIYMSSLALRSLVPQVGAQTTVWSTGLIAAGLSLFSGAWLNRYASFMVVLGGVLVPVGGILLARFFLLRSPVRIESLYDARGELGRHRGFDVAGLTAWGCGGAVYYLAGSGGRTLPALAVAVGVYLLVKKVGKVENASSSGASCQQTARPLGGGCRRMTRWLTDTQEARTRRKRKSGAAQTSRRDGDPCARPGDRSTRSSRRSWTRVLAPAPSARVGQSRRGYRHGTPRHGR